MLRIQYIGNVTSTDVVLGALSFIPALENFLNVVWNQDTAVKHADLQCP